MELYEDHEDWAEQLKLQEERDNNLSNFVESIRESTEKIPQDKNIKSMKQVKNRIEKELSDILTYDSACSPKFANNFVSIKITEGFYISTHLELELKNPFADYNEFEWMYQIEDFPRVAFMARTYNEAMKTLEADPLLKNLCTDAGKLKIETEKKIKLQEIASAAIKALLVSEQKKRSFTYRMEKSSLVTNVTLSGKDSWNFNLTVNSYSDDIDLQEVINTLKTVIQIAPLKNKGV